MTNDELQEGEEVLLEVKEFLKSEEEKYVLRVVRFRDPEMRGWRRPRLEKRRFIKIDGRWKRGNPLTLVAPDIRLIVKSHEQILRSMGEGL